jgi:hypothetical protein
MPAGDVIDDFLTEFKQEGGLPAPALAGRAGKRCNSNPRIETGVTVYRKRRG